MDELKEAFHCHQSGQWEAAEKLYRSVLRQRPSADLLNNLGNVLTAQGKWQDAFEAFSYALQLRSNFVQAKYNLSNLLLQTQQYDAAIAFLKAAVDAHPDFPPFGLNLGNAYQALGDYRKAIVAYQQAIALNSQYFEAVYNQALAYQAIGDGPRAELGYRRALELRPEFSAAWNNLGCLLNQQGSYAAAARCFETSLQASHPSPEVYVNFAASLQEFGQWSKAQQQLELAMKGAPEASLASLIHIKQLLCDWEDLDELSNQAVRLVRETSTAYHRTGRWPTHIPAKSIPPLTFLSLPVVTSRKDQRDCAELWCQGIRRPHSTKVYLPKPSSKRLRLGYVSADFREHPVGFLVSELIAAHALDRYEVFIYSTHTEHNHPVVQRLINLGTPIRCLDSLSLDEATATIEADAIDILLDLQGHTRGARTELFAQRPAPIQVSYLGYPATMGSSFIDYLVADDFVIPSRHAIDYSECIVKLPNCYLTSQRQRPRNMPGLTRQECELPDNAFVLCGFSSSYKLTNAVFDVWLDVLEYSPQCVLWLRDEHPEATANLRRYAQRKLSHADAVHRIIFAPRVSMEFHLQRQTLADLFLDTFPYNQHSTAADALWAGVPVLTIAGTTFASRVAGSLLNSLSMKSFITESLTTYAEQAKFFIDHPQELRQLRQHLAEQIKTSVVFDAKRFVRSLEIGFDHMWERYVAGQAPASFSVPAPDNVNAT